MKNKEIDSVLEEYLSGETIILEAKKSVSKSVFLYAAVKLLFWIVFDLVVLFILLMFALLNDFEFTSTFWLIFGITILIALIVEYGISVLYCFFKYNSVSYYLTNERLIKFNKSNHSKSSDIQLKDVGSISLEYSKVDCYLYKENVGTIFIYNFKGAGNEALRFDEVVNVKETFKVIKEYLNKYRSENLKYESKEID